MTSQRNATVLSLKRYLWALGTVGSSAPFVGLFGTVVGILKAFQSMSVAGTGGFKVVSQGIAAALVATAAGLLVAIYAVIAYNYFVARIGVIAMHYRLFAEEFLTALGQGVKRKPAVVAVAAGPRPPRRRGPEDATVGINVQIDDATRAQRGRRRRRPTASSRKSTSPR